MRAGDFINCIVQPHRQWGSGETFELNLGSHERMGGSKAQDQEEGAPWSVPKKENQ